MTVATGFYLKPGAVVRKPLLHLDTRILDDARILDELLPEKSAKFLRARPHRIKALLSQPLYGKLGAHGLCHFGRQPRAQLFGQVSRGASAAARLGAVIFIHRSGALLNTHLHFHCVVVDGVFEGDAGGGVTFHPADGLDAWAIGEVQVAVRRRLLRAALRRGLLSPKGNGTYISV